MRKATLVICLLLLLSSCTTVRDTTPCNSSVLLKLKERQDLSATEMRTRDSLMRLCEIYEAKQMEDKAAGRVPEEPETPTWLKFGVIGAAALVILYFAGIFG